MQTFHLIVLVSIFALMNPTDLPAESDCDEFVSMVDSTMKEYFQRTRVYPVPADIQQLAEDNIPRLWVHPESWQPIEFSDYLNHAVLKKTGEQGVIASKMSVDSLSALSTHQECGHYFESPDVPAANPAPVYIQIFRDVSPVDSSAEWTYIKYNFVFDWSGLAEKISPVSRAGVFLLPGNLDKWHRLDVHTCAILGFDENRNLQVLALAQHNHQKTYLAGTDFPADKPVNLVAAIRSNELYLDTGSPEPVRHRVVTFFNDVAFLIDSTQKPVLWAQDVTYGRNAGAVEIQLEAEFLQSGHPLADFAGLLAPPKRFLGMYIGRDGPPGYNYYAPPQYLQIPNLMTMGAWDSGELDLLAKLEPYLAGFRDTNWDAILEIMQHHFGEKLQENLRQ